MGKGREGKVGRERRGKRKGSRVYFLFNPTLTTGYNELQYIAIRLSFCCNTYAVKPIPCKH